MRDIRTDRHEINTREIDALDTYASIIACFLVDIKGAPWLLRFPREDVKGSEQEKLQSMIRP